MQNSISLFAVIVTFHPETKDILQLIKILKSQCVPPIVIDNGSLTKDQISKIDSHCILICCTENYGIAKAQNIGIARACELQASHIMFLDQDTKVDQSFIAGMCQAIKIAPPNTAAIGPILIDAQSKITIPHVNITKNGRRIKFVPRKGNELLRSDMLISSGSIISIDTINQVGLMREDLFIDYVDTEWCLRAIHNGYNNYVATNIEIIQDIGSKRIRLWKWNIPVHNAKRRYFRIRNAYILLTIKTTPKLLALREILWNLTHQAIIIVREKNRGTQFKTLIQANLDGLFYFFKKLTCNKKRG